MMLFCTEDHLRLINCLHVIHWSLLLFVSDEFVFKTRNTGTLWTRARPQVSQFKFKPG